MEKISEMAPNGARMIFVLLIRSLQTFWAEQICILIISISLFFLDSRFLDFQIPGFPDSWISRFLDFQIPIFPDSRLSARDSQRILCASSAVAPDHKVGEIQGTRRIL